MSGWPRFEQKHGQVITTVPDYLSKKKQEGRIADMGVGGALRMAEERPARKHVHHGCSLPTSPMQEMPRYDLMRTSDRYSSI